MCVCDPFCSQKGSTEFCNTCRDLEVLLSQGKLTRSLSFCAGLEEADVNVGVEALSRTLVGLEKGRHQMALPALGWKCSRREEGGFLLSHPCPLSKGHPLNQTQMEEKVLFRISLFFFFFFFNQLLLHLLLHPASHFLSSSLHE